ncbi:hypothetical protein OAL43_03410, partial [bacterium]|nr:hypothetical protein [bacterium]
KTGNYRRFSWNMQKMEADIFVDSVYANLASWMHLEPQRRSLSMLLFEASARSQSLRIPNPLSLAVGNHLS